MGFPSEIKVKLHPKKRQVHLPKLLLPNYFFHSLLTPLASIKIIRHFHNHQLIQFSFLLKLAICLFNLLLFIYVAFLICLNIFYLVVIRLKNFAKHHIHYNQDLLIFKYLEQVFKIFDTYFKIFRIFILHKDFFYFLNFLINQTNFNYLIYGLFWNLFTSIHITYQDFFDCL